MILRVADVDIAAGIDRHSPREVQHGGLCWATVAPIPAGAIASDGRNDSASVNLTDNTAADLREEEVAGGVVG